MRSIGFIVIAVTLLLSAVAVWIYLNRDRAQMPQIRRDALNTQVPSPPNSSTIELSNAQTVKKPVPFVPSPKEQVSSAMDEAIVKSMISQARTASLKGDVATTGALVKGLKNHRAASEKLLAAEIAAAPDSESKRHLENILIALSEDRK